MPSTLLRLFRLNRKGDELKLSSSPFCRFAYYGAMLHPIFCQPPDEKSVPSGVVFRILGYTQVPPYTLVRYREGGEEEFGTGEILYRDKEQIASEAGEIPLYSPAPDTPTQTPNVPTTVWDRVDSRMDRFGIPNMTAQQLRDPMRYISLDV